MIYCGRLTSSSILAAAVVARCKVKHRLAYITIEARWTFAHETAHQIHAFGTVHAGFKGTVVYVGPAINACIASSAVALCRERVNPVASTSIEADGCVTRV